MLNSAISFWFFNLLRRSSKTDSSSVILLRPLDSLQNGYTKNSVSFAYTYLIGADHGRVLQKSLSLSFMIFSRIIYLYPRDPMPKSFFNCSSVKLRSTDPLIWLCRNRCAYLSNPILFNHAATVPTISAEFFTMKQQKYYRTNWVELCFRNDQISCPCN